MSNQGDFPMMPCPFCGGTERLVVKPYRFGEDGGEPFAWGFVVQCSAGGFDNDPKRGCGASSGWGETKAEAIDAWNRRAPAPDLVTLPIDLILELVEAARQNTGAEPSVSMFERAVDRVLEYHAPKRWPF